MQIRWANLFAFALVLFAGVLAVRHQDQVSALLGTMTRIRPGHDPNQQTIGLLVFGLILISLLAALRIFLNHNDRENK